MLLTGHQRHLRASLVANTSFFRTGHCQSVAPDGDWVVNASCCWGRLVQGLVTALYCCTAVGRFMTMQMGVAAAE